MKVNGKIFVVTGGANGLGKQIALTILNRGGFVCAVDRNEEALIQFKSELPDKLKQKFQTEVVDLTQREEVEALPEKIRAQFGKVDGIINNAGIIQPFVKVNDLDMKSIERVMNINFFSQVFMIKSFLPYLLKRPEAHIVNISSMGGFLPVPGQSIYGASKAAVKLLSEGLYAELLQTNVSVSVVFPGAMHTNITQNSGVSTPDVGVDSRKIKMLEPNIAAQQIVDGIEKNKLRIFIGKDSKMMNFMYSMAPKFAIRMIAKQMQSLLD